MKFVQRLALCSVLCSVLLFSQRTRPERTHYEETSRYQDVMDFISALKLDSAMMKLTWIGYTAQGKHLPMILFGDIADARPETVRRSGKLVVFIQANIHGGEVEGKEAMLELLRDLRDGKHKEWRRRLIVMIVPILNADGNDMIGLYNRPFQYGPVAGMGQRANGQGYDLNRDHIKLETPEIRAFVKVLNDYDPHITVDLHTTNGSFHGYHITYSFALHPVVDASLDQFTRSVFFPKVEERMRSQRWRIHRYGDYLSETASGTPGYYYWAHEPRYNSNYVGFRNRLAILGESYSYITFPQRIASTKALVVSILDIANGNSLAIKETIRMADAAAMNLRRTDSLCVKAKIVVSDTAQEILLAATREIRNPYSGETMYLMNEDSLRVVTVPEFYGTQVVRAAKVPSHYCIPDSIVDVVTLLRDHGIRVDTVQRTRTLPVQRFRITGNKQSTGEFQRHRMRTLEGEYENVEAEIHRGWFTVTLDQPLSRLAMFLLEPESEDGAVAWNVVDRYLGDGRYYPIYKYCNEQEKDTP